MPKVTNRTSHTQQRGTQSPRGGRSAAKAKRELRKGLELQRTKDGRQSPRPDAKLLGGANGKKVDKLPVPSARGVTLRAGRPSIDRMHRSELIYKTTKVPARAVKLGEAFLAAYKRSVAHGGNPELSKKERGFLENLIVAAEKPLETKEAPRAEGEVYLRKLKGVFEKLLAAQKSAGATTESAENAENLILGCDLSMRVTGRSVRDLMGPRDNVVDYTDPFERRQAIRHEEGRLLGLDKVTDGVFFPSSAWETR